MIIFYKNNIIQFILLVTFLFSLSLTSLTSISKANSNQRLVLLTKEIKNIKNHYEHFYYYYNSLIFPSVELDSMIKIINKIDTLIINTENNYNDINMIHRINISSLLELYKSKNQTFLKIANEYKKNYDLALDPDQNFKQITTDLILIEKYKLLYLGDQNNIETNNRIDTLTDILYNLDNNFLNTQAKNDLNNLLRIFPTSHFLLSNTLEKNIIQKENQIISNNLVI